MCFPQETMESMANPAIKSVRTELTERKNSQESGDQPDDRSIIQPSTQLTRFCFTWNNYKEVDVTRVKSFGEETFDFIVFGREICPSSGTPHLQGYFECAEGKRKTCLSMTNLLDPVVKGAVHHIRLFRPLKPKLAQIRYCTKTSTPDDGFEEEERLYMKEFKVRNKPGPKGASDEVSEGYRDVVESLYEGAPLVEVYREHPEYAVRHASSLSLIHLQARESIAVEKARETFPKMLRMLVWQRWLYDAIRTPAPDREILWIYDPKGSRGKSYFCKWLAANAGVNHLENGRSQDVTYHWAGGPIVYDIPRTSIDLINYDVIERFKNGRLFSPKFHSEMKGSGIPPWVVVFANILPERSRLSADRLSHSVFELTDEMCLLEQEFDKCVLLHKRTFDFSACPLKRVQATDPGSLPLGATVRAALSSLP